MKDYRFVEAKPSDVNALFEFEKKLFPHKADQFSKRNLKHLIVSPTSFTYLLVGKDRKIVGEVIGLIRRFKIPSGRVYKIGVSKSIQEKGIGSRLLKKIEAVFLKKGMKKTCAEVRVSNMASRGMFEKNGYKQTKTIKGWYLDGEDMVKFWKDL